MGVGAARRIKSTSVDLWERSTGPTGLGVGARMLDAYPLASQGGLRCLGQSISLPPVPLPLGFPVSPSVSIRGLTSREAGRAWGSAGSQAVLGLPLCRPAPALRTWIREAERILLHGSWGGTAAFGAPCWRRSAAQRLPPERVAAGPRPPGHRIMSLGRKEMSHIPRAVGRPGASAETRPQELGTMAGSERNVGPAAAALPGRGP